MIRAASRLVSPFDSSSTILIRATGTAAYDTAALQRTINNAADGAIIDGGNTLFTLITADADDHYWLYMSGPSRRVYPAIKITRGNFTLRNFRFRMQTPTTYESGSRATAFATDLNLERGTLRDITFEDCDFDFKDSGTSNLMGAGYFLGVWGLRFIRCRYYTSGTENTVTITSSAGNLSVAWTAHGYSDPASVSFTGDDLPAVIEPGRSYFIRGGATNSFTVSETDDGTVLALASGTYTATAYATQIVGRCVTIDNCDEVTEIDCEYDHIRQGWFSNCNRDVTVTGSRFNMFAEAIDVDLGLTRGRFADLSFTNSFREGQGLDLSNVVDVQIAGLTADRITQAYQIYTKPENAEDYSSVVCSKYPWSCVFTQGSPGTITSVDTNSDGLSVACPIQEDGRFWIDEPSTAHTFPTGASKYTTYRAKNVNSTTGVFQFYADADGTKTAINLTSAASGTFRLYLIADVADVTVSDDILVDNVTITNGLGTDNDIMIATERQERAGTDRAQTTIGIGILVSNIAMTNHNVRNSKRILVNEADNITIRGVKLIDCNPATNAGAMATQGAALVVRQSGNDTTAIAASLLRGSVDDVTIVNSQGMGVYISRPEDLRIGRITVDGYNLQEDDATAYGVRGVSLAERGGIKTFGEIAVKNGTDGSTVTAVDFWPEAGSGTGKFNMLGPFACLTSGAIKVKGDLGNLILNQTRVIIPSQSTVASATINYPLTMDPTRGGKVMAASVQTLGAITGSDPNYTNLRLRKYNISGSYENLTSSQEFDQDAVAANTSRDWGALSSNSATDLVAGEYLVLEFTRAGTGSVTPVFVFSYAVVPFL